MPDTSPRSRLPFPTLGPHGEGWVILQVILIGVIVAAGIWGPAWPPASPWRQLAGVAVGALGVALLLAGVLGLGRQLTPLPRPVAGGALRDRGAYGLVRHPMYGGALLMVLSWALFTSPLALLPFAVTAVFLEAKRRMEEAWLAQHHPGYTEYQRRVRRRLIPFVW